MKNVKNSKLKKLSYLFFYVFLVTSLGIVLNRNLKQLPKILSSSSTGDNKEQITLVKVIDGDTIKVMIGGTEKNVRLIGLNAPETSDCKGDRSKTELEKLLTGQTILLEDDPTQGEKDKYGRLLRYVHTGNGVNVNERIIEIGGAKEYTYDNDYKYKDLFVNAQNTAKKDKLGVWGAPCGQ